VADDQRANGLIIYHTHSKITMENIADPDEILFDQWFIQAHPYPEGRDIFFSCQVAQHCGCRVTWNQMNQ
jgi:alpha-D-ribose 1-methylphosphonate 5-triphosphate synthase subunit PhnH